MKKGDWHSGFHRSTEAPPLSEDATGALRVGNSRVLLEIVVRAFQDGATPETIVQRYSTLALPDVYAVLAYYLRHPNEVEEYLSRREQKAKEVEARTMATNLTEEIAAKVSMLPPERQREALSLIEQLAARATTPRVSLLPRSERRLKGAT